MMSGSGTRFFSPDDPSWQDAFDRLPEDRQDVFYGPGFARLCAATINRHHKIRCAVAETAAGPILYPFALRDLRLVAGPDGEGLSDMVGLYGRNGVVCARAVDGDALARFHADVAAFARSESVICAFDRFHPVMENDAHACADTAVMDLGNFIVLDLRPSLEDVERGYKYSVQKDLRKAERSGVSTFVEAGTEHLDQFIQIYTETMKRNAADEFYYFDREFFISLVREMPGQFVFIYAVVGGEIVSCELALLHGHYSHSFLGGTRHEALPYAANHMLKRDLVRELRRQQCQFFLLGGGVNPDDGIERYKRAYAPEGALPSRIGGLIFDAGAIGELRRRMEISAAAMKPGRFQFYDAK